MHFGNDFFLISSVETLSIDIVPISAASVIQ